MSTLFAGSCKRFGARSVILTKDIDLVQAVAGRAAGRRLVVRVVAEGGLEVEPGRVIFAAVLARETKE